MKVLTFGTFSNCVFSELARKDEAYSGLYLALLNRRFLVVRSEFPSFTGCLSHRWESGHSIDR